MLVAHEFLPDARVELLGEAPPLAPELETKVERLWLAERSRQGCGLFNGHTFSAVAVEPARLAGHRIEYRRLIAQRLCPELFDSLRVRPVGVSGLLQCADGIVFGRRARTGVQHPGLWELAPSGGIDTTDAVQPGVIDVRSQVLTELTEEVGLNRDQVGVPAPFCLVEDEELRVLDIGFALTAPALTAGAILATHQASGSREYDELAVIPRGGLQHFLEQIGEQLMPVSRMLLSLYQ